MARQPTVRPVSTETRLNYDPPASVEVKPARRDHQHSPSGRGPEPSSSAPAFDEVLKLVAEQACLATSASACAIALFDGHEVVCRATAGPYAPELGARLDTSSGLTGACVRTRQFQYCEDTENDARVNAAACRRLQVRSVLVVPLLQQDEFLGIVEIFSPFPQAFARHDWQNLEALSQVVLDNINNSTGAALSAFDDEPLFASAASSEPVEPWVDAALAPVEPAAPPLELSAIRWEPPEAQASFPDSAPLEHIPESRMQYPEPAANELFSSRIKSLVSPVESFSPPSARILGPKWPVAPAPKPVVTPPPPLPPASALPLPATDSSSFQITSQPVAADASGRGREWTTTFLTLTVIGVALLLGWMLGHAGWQHVVGTVRTAAASYSNKPAAPPLRAVAGAEASAAADASDAVFPTAAKPSHVHKPFEPKSAGDPREGGLVVYEGGKIIFQQNAPRSKPADFTKSAEPQSAAGKSNAPGDPVSLSPELASSFLIRRVEPVYPEEARQQNIEGEVHLEALVGKDGKVQVLRLISGDSELAEAAADAVRQWRFRPYQSEGKPEAFSTRLTVSFRLQ